MEKRKYDRVRVKYPASFSGASYRAQGTVVSLSMVGCRARTTFFVREEECLGILIEVPGYAHPLYIAQAVVRWFNEQEFGMEIVHMELEDRQRLGEVIRAIEAAPERPTE